MSQDFKTSASGAPFGGASVGDAEAGVSVVPVFNATTKEYEPRTLPTGGGATVQANRSNETTELPTTGPFAGPSEFTIAVDVPAGGKILVHADAEIRDTAGSAQTLDAQITAGVEVLDTYESVNLDANARLLLSVSSEMSFVAAQTGLSVSVGYNCTAGAEFLRGCMSVTVIPPA